MKTSSNFVIVYDFETGGLPSKEKQAFLDIPLVEMAMSCIDMKKLEIIDRVEMIFPYNYKEGLAGYSEEATAVHIERDIQHLQEMVRQIQESTPDVYACRAQYRRIR